MLGFQSMIAELLTFLPGWISNWISSPQGQMTLKFLPHLLLALALGGLLGYERRLKHKVAGVRTHMVIAASSCIITLCGVFMSAGQAGVDSTRLAAQVLAGIGFVGAGVILRRGFNTSGVTTASTILFSAAVGIACGFGFFVMATVATVLTVTAMVVTYRIFPSNEIGGHILKVVCPLTKFDEVKGKFGTSRRVDSLQKLSGDLVEFRLHTDLNAQQLDKLVTDMVKDPDIQKVDMIDDPN